MVTCEPLTKRTVDAGLERQNLSGQRGPALVAQQTRVHVAVAGADDAHESGPDSAAAGS